MREVFLVGFALLGQKLIYKDDIKIVIQFSCLFGTPCTCLFGTPCTWSTNINIKKQGRTRALCREGTDMARVPCQKDTLFWKPLADDYYYNLISKILKIIYFSNKILNEDDIWEEITLFGVFPFNNLINSLSILITNLSCCIQWNPKRIHRKNLSNVVLTIFQWVL